jgi:sarcosine oxidase gamma subunit/5-hydroxyisourate hydrolase-like protein (transthyretin family)
LKHTTRNSAFRLLRFACALATLSGFLFALSSSAQSKPAVATRNSGSVGTTATGSYPIAGILINAVTGEPVRRATVSVLAEEDSHAVESTVSDNDGRFSLERLPTAKYQLTASKRGFRTAFYDEHDEFSSAIVTGADQDTSHLTFRLTPSSVLRGVVSTDGGDPVEGARVLLFQRPQHRGPGERTLQADATVTDDTGAYEFSNLAAGEYLLAVVAEPWYAMHGAEGGPRSRSASEVNPALDVAYPVTYFDSTTDEGEATPIVLAGGGREEANINIHAVPALHLQIATPRKQDGSIARAELQKTVFGTVVTSESAGFLDALQSGTVDMGGVAPGHYQLTQGEPARIVDLDVSTSQQVDPNAGNAAAAVAGTLRMDSGQPIAEEVNLTLEPFGDGRDQSELVAVAHKGRFTFATVTPGAWTLWAEGGGKMLSVVATSTGGTERAGNILNVRDHLRNVVVTLSQGKTRIEGFGRKDGKGLAGVMVVLAPKDPAAWQALLRRDQSDSDGSFALRDVAPGQYTVIAVEDGWSLDWTRPEVMARFLPKGTAVTVTDKSGSLMRLSSRVAVQMR